MYLRASCLKIMRFRIQLYDFKNMNTANLWTNQAEPGRHKDQSRVEQHWKQPPVLCFWLCVLSVLGWTIVIPFYLFHPLLYPIEAASRNRSRYGASDERPLLSLSLVNCAERECRILTLAFVRCLLWRRVLPCPLIYDKYYHQRHLRFLKLYSCSFIGIHICSRFINVASIFVSISVSFFSFLSVCYVKWWRLRFATHTCNTWFLTA